MQQAEPGVAPLPAPAKEALFWHHPLAILLAVAGGFLGIIGAGIEEIRAGAVFIVAFVAAAPVIEEALKPTGIYIALVRWPHIMRGQLYTASMASLGGLTFGIIESLIYVTVYVEDPTDAFIAYRFSVTLALHAAASFLVGLGLNRGVVDWAAGRSPFPRRTLRLYVAGTVLHGVYNVLAVALSVAGVLDFD